MNGKISGTANAYAGNGIENGMPTSYGIGITFEVIGYYNSLRMYFNLIDPELYISHRVVGASYEAWRKI